MHATPQRPGRSKQDFGTPRAFLDAVERKFGPITFDLAANASNAVCAQYFSEKDDALKQSWELPGHRVVWLNPPFGTIEDWAEKLAECIHYARWTLMLVPASVDAHWYRDHVLNKMMTWGMPRMRFVGAKSAYPKALMLCGAGFGVAGHGYWPWSAKQKLARSLLRKAA